MASTAKPSTQHVGPRPKAEDQRNNSSEGRPPTTPESNRRTLIWILRILIVLFVLNRSLNQSLAQLPTEPEFIYIRSNAAKDREKKFDYYVLNMNWPVTVCARYLVDDDPSGERPTSHGKVGQIKQKPTIKLVKNFLTTSQTRGMFTIHGLWPSKSVRHGDEPRYCKDIIGFSGAFLSTLRNINEFWPSFIQTHEGFWKEEWLKHGTCAIHHRKVNTFQAYFTQALILAERIHGKIQEDLKREYLKEGIPDNPLTYQNLLDFFKFHHGNTVKIHYQVVPMRGGAAKEAWVESVDFCFDLRFRERDCPPSYFKPRDVLFLPSVKRLDKIVTRKDAL